MALANHRVRVFEDVFQLEKFIREDANINGIVSIGDIDGRWVLVFTVA